MPVREIFHLTNEQREMVQKSRETLFNKRKSESFEFNRQDEVDRPVITPSPEKDRTTQSSANNLVGNSSEIMDDSRPYCLTIAELAKLQWESSPLAKFDLVYNALKYKLAEEVDLFWEGYDKFHSGKQRIIDIDNLQGITIYIVWALQRPTIIVDCFIITEFLSRTAKKSTRATFLLAIQASLDFLLKLGPSKSEEG